MSRVRVSGGGLRGWGPYKRDDVDPVVVLRLSWGERLPSAPVERREAVRTLTRRGYSASSIARMLGVAERSVHRYRSAGVVQVERRRAAS